MSGLATRLTWPAFTGRNLAVFAVLVFSIGLTVGAATPVGIVVPDDDPSVAMLLDILKNNVILLAALAGIAALQRFARHEIQQGSAPWIRRLTDLVLLSFLTINLISIGYVIGQLHLTALERIVPHAWLEIPAFTLGIWGYLLARNNRLERRAALVIYPAALIMLAAGATIETYVTGRI